MWICRMFQLQGSGESKSPERVRGSFTVTQLFSSVVKEKKTHHWGITSGELRQPLANT